MGRLLCFSLDDPRVHFDTGLVMRGMSTPRVLDEARLHRVVRYIVRAPKVHWLFRRQGGGETFGLDGLADADRAAVALGSFRVATNLRCHLFWRKRVPRFNTHLHEELGRRIRLRPRGRTSSQLGLISREGHCEPQRCWEAQASSGQKSFAAAGPGGRTGESRQGRHVAEHGRLGHQVLGCGAAEAADGDES